MKSVQFLIIALIVACLSLDGCSLAMWARIFNRSGHEIFVKDHEGKKFAIAPGGNAPVALWAAMKGLERGFVIFDGDRELFFAMRPDTKAEQQDTRSTSALLPSVSAKSTLHGLEYLFEYGGDSQLFALVSGSENPLRSEPQPIRFPIQPNKTTTANDLHAD